MPPGSASAATALLLQEAAPAWPLAGGRRRPWPDGGGPAPDAGLLQAAAYPPIRRSRGSCAAASASAFSAFLASGDGRVAPEEPQPHGAAASSPSSASQRQSSSLSSFSWWKKESELGQAILEQRKRHNEYLDKGLKFNISYRSPTIVASDIFDLERFGCHKGRGRKWRPRWRRKQEEPWWEHPSILFAGPWGRIGVRLQDLTSGELKWDAVYDLQRAPRSEAEVEKLSDDVGQAPPAEPLPADDPDQELADRLSAGVSEDAGASPAPPEAQNGESEEHQDAQGDRNFLPGKAKPVGGSHPFFLPDWCPAPSDGYAHRYRLTVTNLSQFAQPGQDSVGEMLFTQYGPSQLDNTYAYEDSFSKQM